MSATDNLRLRLEDLFHGQAGITVAVKECLHSAVSPFQRIAVYDTPAFGRILTLGGDISITELDEAMYSEMMVHPAISTVEEMRHVLVLGGGDGGIVREVLRYEQVERVTVVEIDRMVIDVAAHWFPKAAASLKDPRVEVVIDDAHRYLRDHTGQFDAIIIDACELANAPSDAFHQESFSAVVLNRLDPKGVLVAPLGNPMFESEICRTTLRRLQERFDPQVFQIHLPSLPCGTWAVATCGVARDAAPVHLPTGKLTAWHPGLDEGLFELPLNVRASLGL